MVARSGSGIEITGVRPVVRALESFAPDIEFALDQAIKDSLQATKSAAQAKYPEGLWVIGRTKKKLLGYIAARAGGKRAARWGDSSGGIKAAIFEFAGSVQPGRTPQAQGLISHLDEKYGDTGRFLWDAWDETGAEVLDDINVYVRVAEAELQARLDGAGEGY